MAWGEAFATLSGSRSARIANESRPFRYVPLSLELRVAAFNPRSRSCFETSSTSVRRGRELSLDFSSDGHGLNGHWFVDPQETPFDALSRQEQLELVENALRMIDSRLRYAVVMRDIEGMSYQEIADTLKVSLGTVKSRILRGRETLKKRLQREVRDTVPESCALQPE